MSQKFWVLLFGCCFLGAVASIAKETTPPNAFEPKLKSVSVAELPAAAAGLVAKANLADREATTVEVVQAAIARSPKAAAAIVGAIAKAVPEMAATAAATATKLQPKLAKAIAKAAAKSAPARANEITMAVQGAVTAASKPVASTAANQLPTAFTPRGPSVGPPYVPLSGTPGNINPGTSGVVPTGGRNYASP